MIKTFCDRCGRELEEGCVNQVNVDFNYFGTSRFDPHGQREFQFCPECAERVHEWLMEQKSKLTASAAMPGKEGK